MWTKHLIHIDKLLYLCRNGRGHPAALDVSKGGHSLTPTDSGWQTKLGEDRTLTQKYQKKGKYHWHVVVDGLST